MFTYLKKENNWIHHGLKYSGSKELTIIWRTIYLPFLSGDIPMGLDPSTLLTMVTFLENFRRRYINTAKTIPPAIVTANKPMKYMSVQ